MNNKMSVLQKINQLERQILVHSIIYYRLGTSIWTDLDFDTSAKLLKKLIEDEPEAFSKSVLYEDFKTFDWVSGYDLPIYDSHYTKIAEFLINYKAK